MSVAQDRGEGRGRRYIAALLHFSASVLWELGLCFLSPSSPSPCRSIPFTTCTPLKRPVSGFLYFFPHSVLSLLCFPSLLTAPCFFFLHSLQTVQANLCLCRSAAGPECVFPPVPPVLFTNSSLNYREEGDNKPESSFHLYNLVYRHTE